MSNDIATKTGAPVKQHPMTKAKRAEKGKAIPLSLHSEIYQLYDNGWTSTKLHSYLKTKYDITCSLITLKRFLSIYNNQKRDVGSKALVNIATTLGVDHAKRFQEIIERFEDCMFAALDKNDWKQAKALAECAGLFHDRHLNLIGIKDASTPEKEPHDDLEIIENIIKTLAG